MENNIEGKKEHWISKVTAIKAKDIFELADKLNEISSKVWVIASQVYPTKEGYDSLVYYKVSPEDNLKKELGIAKSQIPVEVMREILEEKRKAGPTQRQLDFLIQHKFKVRNDLTKNEATQMIREYLDRLNKDKNIRKEELSDRYEDY